MSRNEQSDMAKLVARQVAQELSMQGFVLEHELALRGDWSEAKVDKTVLEDVANKLMKQAVLLRRAAR
jgi:hypothetical protein